MKEDTNMTIEAIQKINAEMQKNPTDPYTEIIGHYVIDRCGDDATAALILKDGKTLAGAMQAVTGVASKAKHGNVAVLTPAQVFGAVDRYFSMTTDPKAQQKALAGMGAPIQDVTTEREPQKKLGLDLASFM